MKSDISKKKTSRQTIYYVIFLLAWTTISLIASQFIVAFIMMAFLGDTIMLPMWTAIYDLLVYLFALILIAIIPPLTIKQYQKYHRHQNLQTLRQDLELNPNEMGIKSYPTLTDIGLVPVGYIIYILTARFLTYVMQLFPWFDADEAQDVGFNILAPGLDRVVALLALVIIAPIVEELVMRGWLYGKIRAKLSPLKTTLLVSLLFAVLHGQWNVGISTFCLSLILCSLREITGSVWSGILLHMLNNGIAFYFLYIASGF